jgi:hypothetical protein
MSSSVSRAFLVTAALLVAAVAGFKVCGYYCGPNWCSNEVISEEQCVSTGIWGIPSASGNCADGCCRIHDDCCGKGLDRPACNDAIVDCIQSNRCYFSVCGALVWAAMKVVDDWCCGSRCPTYFLPTPEQPEMSLDGKAFCHDSGLRVEMDATHITVRSAAGQSCEAIPYALNQTSNEVQFEHTPCHVKTLHMSPAFTEEDTTIVTYLPYTEQIVYRNDRRMSLSKC